MTNTLHKTRQETENASREETQEEDNEDSVDIASTPASFYDDTLVQGVCTIVTGSELENSHGNEEKEEEKDVEMEIQQDTTEQVEGSILLTFIHFSFGMLSLLVKSNNHQYKNKI